MTETQAQSFEKVAPGDIASIAEKMKGDGYRMVQICGITKEGHTELLYTFDRDFQMVNLTSDVPFGTSVASITPWYWSAFVYENEVHDLFGIEFTDSKLDYKGNFFRMSAKTPWKGKEAAPEQKEGA